MARRGISLLFVTLLALAPMVAGVPDHPELDLLDRNDTPVQMNFKQTSVSKVLGSMAAAGGFKLILVEGFEDQHVTIDIGKTSMKAALIEIANKANLRYEVPRKGELVVSNKR